jgi:lipoate---protein ligase
MGLIKGSAKLKTPGGKLVSVRVEYDELIRKVEILGDFFIYPESALAEIERSLVDLDANSTEPQIAAKIKKVTEAKKVEMMGVTPESIATTLRNAMVAQ